jgi:hypothetical protein
MSKNLEHSKAKTKTFNLFEIKNKNLQSPRAKIKAFSLFKRKNTNLQPPRAKKKAHKHKCMNVIDALGQIY